MTLTAGEAPSFGDLARIASEVTGRTITLEVVGDAEWLAAQSTPEPLARFTLGFYQAARRGDFTGVDPLLGKLLGREPRTVREQLAA